MNTYKITVDLFVRADNIEGVRDTVEDELTYLCEQDNNFAAWDYTPDTSITLEEEDDSETLCAHCNGSGEGMYDGTTCSYCHGSGVESEGEEE